MNVFDFDETIFTGDVENRFADYMFKKKGFRLYRLKWDFLEFLSKDLKVISRTKARNMQYSFLAKVDDIDNVVLDYWSGIEKHLKPWYNEIKRPDDVIASGTPRFLLEPIVKKLGIGGLVATEMDKKTGKIDGDFAVGEYKVVNFKKQYGLDCIDNFYSDAYSDHFIAEYAKKAFIIHGENDECTEWNEYFKAHPELKK